MHLGYQHQGHDIEGTLLEEGHGQQWVGLVEGIMAEMVAGEAQGKRSHFKLASMGARDWMEKALRVSWQR